MTTDHGPEPTSRTSWRGVLESLPARWGMTGMTLAVLVGGALWLVFDNVALGIVFGFVVATSLGWIGTRRDAGRPGRDGGPAVGPRPG